MKIKAMNHFMKIKIDKEIVNKAVEFAKGNHLPDIMNFPNGNVDGELKYNNIIYYHENINYKKIFVMIAMYLKEILFYV